MKILYESPDFLAVVKPAGVLSEDSGKTDSVPGMLRAEGRKEVYPVHRLDRAVGGVMIYALNKKACGKLSVLVSERAFEKEYLAVVHGTPDPPEGEMRDLLFKDSAKNKSYVVRRMRKGVKEAVLEYSLLGTVLGAEGASERFSLVRIRLHTGRSHQIRVQFSSRKMPLLGDHKYGSREDGTGGIALWSNRIRFALDGKEYDFVSEPEGERWNRFEGKF